MTRVRWGRRPQPIRHLLPDETEYSAQWHELELLGDDGRPEATISATSYTVEGHGRPVVFFWNGGPGASSTPLHFEGFGPHLRGPNGFRSNPDTLLPEADLVFVDPVGTGASRLLSDSARENLLSVPGDAESVAALMREWLRCQGRAKAAVHLVGESFGGYRLLAVLDHVGDLDVRSLTLISPLLSLETGRETESGDHMTVFQLPVLAAAHAHHSGEDPAKAWDEAEEFAEDSLLRQLFRAEPASTPSSRICARRIAALTGLPAELVLEHRLRVPSEVFLRRRLAERELLIGRLDTRITGPLPATQEGRPLAADDPALGLRGDTVIMSPTVASHLAELIGMPEAEYVGLSLDLNFAWDWSSEFDLHDNRPDRLSALGDFANDRTALCVLLIGGRFDLATPFPAASHALRHTGIDPAQCRTLLLDSGHSIDVHARPAALAALREQLLH